MTQKKKSHLQNDNTLPIKDLLFLCIANWHWFVMSLLVTLSVAALYILTTPPVYVSRASILIKNDVDNKSAQSTFTRFSDNYRSDATEELKTMQSPALMIEAIKRLDLDVSYTEEGFFYNSVMYEKSLPAKLKFLDLGKNSKANLTMQVSKDGEICLWDIKKGEEKPQGMFIRAHDGDTVESSVGRIVATLNNDVTTNRGKNIFVKRIGLNEATENFYSRFSANFENENTTIANLRMADYSTARGRDILKAIIDIYNEQWLIDKNQIVVSTDTFLSRRIELLQKELWKLDGQISTQQSRDITPDKSSSVLIEKEGVEKELLALTNQLQIVSYLKELLKEKENYLLPNNIGLQNADVQTIISEYNKTLLRRNSLAQNSSDENPIVKDYDNRLRKLKEGIITTAENEIAAINSQIKLTKKIESKSNEAIESSPEQAKKLQHILRQQKVKNALYLFLLQKREENELSKEFTASITRIISAPSSSWAPVAPLKKNAITMALAMGLLIPAMIIFLKEMSNKKLRGRKDLEGINIPFVGEIPMYLPEDRKEAKKYLENKSEKKLVVKNFGRDIINEAFRVLRTNLQFITLSKEECKVMILTSFNPNSGKTFLAMNTAATLALKGDKVLVIDGDMRHASASAYVSSPKKGLSNYLSGETDNIDECIVKYPEYENLDILPVGTIPPNPTELLNSQHFTNLIALMRKTYNYILIDCPPVEIVADTHIIEQNADHTLFIVRAGLLERGMLSELEKMHEEKRLKNIAIILNGTISHNNYYRLGYRYGYKYRYSYRYGYRYGNKKG